MENLADPKTPVGNNANNILGRDSNPGTLRWAGKDQAWTFRNSRIYIYPMNIMTLYNTKNY